MNANHYIGKYVKADLWDRRTIYGMATRVINAGNVCKVDEVVVTPDELELLTYLDIFILFGVR